MRDPRYIPDLEDLDWEEDGPHERRYPLDDEGRYDPDRDEPYVEEEEPEYEDWYYGHDE